MKWTGERLKSAVRQSLRQRGYEKECLPLEDVADEIGETISNLSRKIKIYKWPGMVLLILIPVISTSLSVMVTNNGHSGTSWFVVSAETVVWLSYGLTLLTLFNSIFAPRERFTSLCHMGIPLHELAVSFLAELEMLPEPIQEHDLHALAERFDRNLFPYKKGLISLFLPQTDVASVRGLGFKGSLKSKGVPLAQEPQKKMRKLA